MRPLVLFTPEALRKGGIMTDKSDNNILCFPEQEHPIYISAKITGGWGQGFFWYSSSIDANAQKPKQAQSIIWADFEKPKDNQRAWQYITVFYHVHDIVALEKFLADFDIYSAAAVGLKTRSDRALREIGFGNPKEAEEKVEVVNRHNRIVEVIRQAAYANATFIHYGHKYIQDLSCGETRFNFVFLDIPRLFLWLVNESGIDPTWIPYPINEYVRNNRSGKGMATDIPLSAVDVSKKKKNRIRHNISITDAAKACGKSPRTIERWLAGENTPSGFPGLNDSGAFLAFVEMYKGRKAIFSPRHRSGNMQKTKHGYNYLPDALPADDGPDT
jgi:hypothetical protein